MLFLKNITKYYDNSLILNNISLSLHPGTVLGLIGKNGSGKTTLLNIISGILHPDTGNIQINLNKNSIGYLKDNNPLYTYMYVIEYIDMILNIYGLKYKFVKKYINILGLNNVLKYKIENISHGYKKRLGIFQSIFFLPDLILWDEPNNGLDYSQTNYLTKLICELRMLNKIIIISSHDIIDLKRYCNRFIIIDKGNIILDQENIDLNNIYNFLS